MNMTKKVPRRNQMSGRRGKEFNSKEGLILEFDGLVLRYEGLHDAPANEVGYGADAEHDHVGSGLTFEAKELESTALSCCPVEEAARAEVDGHRADTASHGAQTYDGTDGRLGEHVANGREEVG